MDTNCMRKIDGSDNSDGDGDRDRPSEHREEKFRSLTDSLYDGPLNHIIRNHPKLFVRPRDWTKRHAEFLHVVCKEEDPWFLPSTQHCQQTKQQEHESLVQHTDKSTFEPRESESEDTRYHASSPGGADTDILRVPPFRFPSLPRPHLNSHIGRLRNESAFVSHSSRQIAMKSLLVWKRPRPSKIWRTLLNPDHATPEPIKTCDYKGDNNTKDPRHRLNMKCVLLCIEYGTRLISMGLSPQTFTLAGDTSYSQKNAWRLIYLDRSQLKTGRSLSRRERKRLSISKRLGIDTGIGPSTMVSPNDNGDERDDWPVSQGYMASLFIAMAQDRHWEVKLQELARQSTVNTQEASHASSHGIHHPLQIQPRYQILLTDNHEDSSYIHLYTAQVSDFLLEHFRNPAHFPHVAPSDHEPYLLKIHHTKIPFAPYKTFRRRLRMTIMEYANGTAGGFFSNPNPPRDGNQEQSSKCIPTTVKAAEADEPACPKQREEINTQACAVA
ncbi:hypothetical protein FHL15_000513 [Xylaria flabelliformis]|uniref:Uncharacterized protein n=1 Tax=Xylaria flabelliformis TaxID=2512241 RepID=A0A553IE18_9PEZI|nr:hypothetical protein FHL15_000513 [Xylaria flabelliformis]